MNDDIELLINLLKKGGGLDDEIKYYMEQLNRLKGRVNEHTSDITKLNKIVKAMHAANVKGAEQPVTVNTDGSIAELSKKIEIIQSDLYSIKSRVDSLSTLESKYTATIDQLLESHKRLESRYEELERKHDAMVSKYKEIDAELDSIDKDLKSVAQSNEKTVSKLKEVVDMYNEVVDTVTALQEGYDSTVDDTTSKTDEKVNQSGRHRRNRLIPNE